MINKIEIEKLCSRFDLYDLERHLIYYFLQYKNIIFRKSNYLNNYFKDFEINNSLLENIRLLNIEKLKDLEKCLELSIPANDRKLNGAFFTPDNIVNLIIENVDPQITDTNLDPSCGCGAFLIGVAEYLHFKYKKTYKDIFEENIFGVDILEYNVRRTKLLLVILGILNLEYIEEHHLNIEVKDSTRNNFSRKYNNVIGNPPYVKFQDLGSDIRDHLLSNYKSISKGTFNLYFAFFELSYNLLEDNGKLGFITPNNYFTSLSGESLRKYFSSTRSIYKIIDFSHKKVFDVQTYTAITFLRKKENEYIQYSRIENNEEITNYIENLVFSENYYQDLSPKKWRLLLQEEKKIINTIENIGTPIGKLFTINVGIATLKDEVFFVNSKEKTKGYYEKEYNGVIYEIEKEVLRSVYKISEFQCQSEIDLNSKKIIFPYKYINGKAQIIEESEFQKVFPKCYIYLLHRKEELQQRSGSDKLSYFYQWGRSQGLNKKGVRILTPTFSQNPRFLYIKEEESFFTNGYGIFINDNDKKNLNLFTSNCNLLNNENNFDVVQKILNSVLMHYYVKKTSVAIDGGYPCYQKNFIEKFSIPDFLEDEIKALRSLNKKNDIDDFLIKKYKLESEKNKFNL